MASDKRRLGILLPSANTAVESEFWRIAPAGLSIHSARMRNRYADREDGIRLLDHVERASDELSSARCDVIAFCCTTSSFINGPGGEAELQQRIERAGLAPAVTTSGAVVAALRAIGAHRISLATPYLPDINEAEVEFLIHFGFDVAAEDGLAIKDAFDIASVPSNEVEALARSVFRPDADAVFISCTNLPTLDSLARLEADLGRPVISSNQATFWASQHQLGLASPISGFGTLLEQHLPMPA